MGSYEKAFGLFNEARVACSKLDEFSYVGVLSACCQTVDIVMCKVIRGVAVVCGLAQRVLLTNLFIDVYCKCERVDQARLLIQSSDGLDTVSWNSLIARVSELTHAWMHCWRRYFKSIVKFKRSQLETIEKALILVKLTESLVAFRNPSSLSARSVIVAYHFNNFRPMLGCIAGIVMGIALLLSQLEKLGFIQLLIYVALQSKQKLPKFPSAAFRRKVKHELISNESARKLTFKKRRAGLLKKLMELTTLCGVIACAIIFSAYNSSPDIWPSHPEAVSVLEKFKRLPPKKQSKYMMDQESFLTRNISKLNEKLEKQRKKNERIELELIYAKCITGENLDPLNSLMNMNDISHLLKENLEYMTDRIDAAKDKIEE
ncbi:hypothetical protein GH714_022047 [Hevea brasiliensis]|uniref:MADS-box domain-containing protein n=1 Tax=Hevea brasiliensis TaxID=3981 RepID=A0A6A6L8T0_HEVBR|nr:hypothetical protein GH714_022047 [Hevea brasiliensis]